MKRKANPLWIREALEKREKQKQKEMAKQEEASNIEGMKQEENAKDTKKNIVIKMKSDKVSVTTRFMQHFILSHPTKDFI